jgi:hypothetical protein
MPCNSDYLNPTRRESELQRTANLLGYVLIATGRPVPPEITAASGDMYCKADFVTMLCAEVSAMDDVTQSRVIYDGRNPTARDLANWWDEHRAADETRRKAGAAEALQRANEIHHQIQALTDTQDALLKPIARDLMAEMSKWKPPVSPQTLESMCIRIDKLPPGFYRSELKANYFKFAR